MGSGMTFGMGSGVGSRMGSGMGHGMVWGWGERLRKTIPLRESDDEDWQGCIRKARKPLAETLFQNLETARTGAGAVANLVPGQLAATDLCHVVNNVFLSPASIALSPWWGL